MSDRNELLRYAADAIGSLKAAWVVAITTAGSGSALLLNVIEGIVGLVGTAMAIVLTYWLIQKAKADRLRAVAAKERDEFELQVLRDREDARLSGIKERGDHHDPLRRGDDSICASDSNQA